MLTKKHFELLATALARARPPAVTPAQLASTTILPELLQAQDEQWVRDIDHVCQALADINPRFDKERFTDWITNIGRGTPGK